MASVPKFLIGYLIVVTVLLVILLFLVLRRESGSMKELTVQRVNIVEPGGTLRMVISSHDRLPGVIVRGQERPPVDRPQAGILFYNDESSEIGGLIFGGRRDAQGHVRDAGGMLSFDRFEGNQTVQLMGVHDQVDQFAGLIVSDSQPSQPSQPRIRLGRDGQGAAALALLDTQGRRRLVLAVAPDGQPSVTVLDEQGKVVKQLLSPAT